MGGIPDADHFGISPCYLRCFTTWYLHNCREDRGEITQADRIDVTSVAMVKAEVSSHTDYDTQVPLTTDVLYESSTEMSSTLDPGLTGVSSESTSEPKG